MQKVLDLGHYNSKAEQGRSLTNLAEISTLCLVRLLRGPVAHAVFQELVDGWTIGLAVLLSELEGVSAHAAAGIAGFKPLGHDCAIVSVAKAGIDVGVGMDASVHARTCW